MARDLVSVLEHKNFYEILQFGAETYGDAPAITNCGKDQTDHSYRDLLAEVRSLAAGLKNRRTALNDNEPRRHIVLCAKNCYDWVLCFFATIVAGEVIIPIDADLTEGELADALINVDATEMVTDREIEHSQIPVRSLKEYIKSNTLENSNPEEEDFSNEDDHSSILLMTSGVTSSPKFVCLSQKNVLYSTLNGLDAVPIEAGKRVLSVLPPHHSYEISCGLLYNLCSGSHIYINDEKINTINNIKALQPQCIAAVPSLINGLHFLMKATLVTAGNPHLRTDRGWIDALEIIYCSGAAANPDYIRAMKEQDILVLQGYGKTECSPAITFNRLDDWTPDTLGKPLRFVELRINDNREIFVKAPNVMKGYYKNRSATEEVLRDGWLATGDAGYMDEEGRLILCGKNVIILNNGENIYPEELEEKIFRQSQGVNYCRVLEIDGAVSAEVYSDDGKNSMWRQE